MRSERVSNKKTQVLLNILVAKRLFCRIRKKKGSRVCESLRYFLDYASAFQRPWRLQYA